MSGAVAVIGTVNHDTVVDTSGAARESLGGILYNVLVLAALVDGTGARVKAFGRLGEEDRNEAERLVAALPAADLSGLVTDSAGTNRSVLDYSRGAERVESAELRCAPLSPQDLSGAESCSVCLINMISGHDLSLETARTLRSRSRGLWLLDVQALARTTGTPRRPRAEPSWRAWCQLFDVVRGNEAEIASFPGLARDASAGARRILDAGAHEVLVTRGALGSWRFPAGGPREEIPAVTPAGPVSDPTGCGDAYLAGVCAARLLGLDASDAPWLGSWAAARVAAAKGLGAWGALSRHEAARELPRLHALAG